ncbi:MAG: GNAT family N-acetyltransferase [Iphinoe sp. HA4291-MV1]|nr:GNAT family N-acetyltransferase [Iphinoe sp. HA4291-MV1]
MKSDPWMILAAQPDDSSSYVAFLPLGIKVIKKYGLNLSRNIYMGGNYYADHTGFICQQEYEFKAIQAFSTYIQHYLKWDKFHLEDVLDARLDLFLKYFEQKQFNIQRNTGTGCPYIPLPNNWETYLQDYLGQWLRRDIRRGFKKVESREQFHVTYLGIDNLEEQIEALLVLNQLQWGAISEETQKIFRSIFHHCFKNNLLWSCVLWDEKAPVAALIAFVEHQKKIFMAYLIGHDSKYEKLKPGKIVYGYSIKYAIENGFSVYDLGRGDYEYKYQFGGKKCFNINVLIARKNPKFKFLSLAKYLKSIVAGKT